MRWLALALLLSSTAQARTDTFQRGVCYAHAWHNRGADGYGSPTSQKTLQRLRHLGVGWISLTPFGFMRSPTDTEVHLATHGGESDERLRTEVAHAHALRIK